MYLRLARPDIFGSAELAEASGAVSKHALRADGFGAQLEGSAAGQGAISQGSSPCRPGAQASAPAQPRA